MLVQLETEVLPERKRCITKKTHLFISHIQEDDAGLQGTVFMEVFIDIRVCAVTFGGNRDPVKGGLSDDEWQKLVLQTCSYCESRPSAWTSGDLWVYLDLYFLYDWSVLQWISYHYSNKAVSEQPFCLTFISCAVLKKTDDQSLMFCYQACGSRLLLNTEHTAMHKAQLSLFNLNSC